MKIDVGYQSPVIRYDPLARTEVFETRNVQTGEVAYQEPSAAAVKRLQNAPVESSPPAEVQTSTETTDEAAPKTPVTATKGGFSLIV
jgi:hypothetical protein